jgi:hypothetical protein
VFVRLPSAVDNRQRTYWHRRNRNPRWAGEEENCETSQNTIITLHYIVPSVARRLVHLLRCGDVGINAKENCFILPQMAAIFQVSVFSMTCVVDLSPGFFMHSSNSPPVTHCPVAYTAQNRTCCLSFHQHFFNIFSYSRVRQIRASVCRRIFSPASPLLSYSQFLLTVWLYQETVHCEIFANLGFFFLWSFERLNLTSFIYLWHQHVRCFCSYRNIWLLNIR